MPLLNGYSRKTIGRNIAKMEHEGYTRDQAVAAALERARRSFRKRHPEKPMPAHLASRDAVGPNHRFGKRRRGLVVLVVLPKTGGVRK